MRAGSVDLGSQGCLGHSDSGPVWSHPIFSGHPLEPPTQRTGLLPWVTFLPQAQSLSHQCERRGGVTASLELHLGALSAVHESGFRFTSEAINYLINLRFIFIFRHTRRARPFTLPERKTWRPYFLSLPLIYSSYHTDTHFWKTAAIMD